MKITRIILALFIAFFITSCSDDDNKDEETAINFAEGVKVIDFLPGNERFDVVCVFGKSEDIRKNVLVWRTENKIDSIVTVIDKTTMATDTLRFSFDAKENQIFEFTAYNYDNNGVKSAWNTISGYAYGDKYLSTLENRVLYSIQLINPNVDARLSWDFLKGNGYFGEEITYLDKNGKEKKAYLAENENSLDLKDCDTTIPLSIRTMYKPKKNAIDTFYTEYEQYVFPEVVAEKTKPYAYLTLTGDASVETVPNSWNNLWNGEAQTTWKGYSAIGYSNLTTTGSATADAIWITMNIGQPMHVSRVRADYYYYKDGTAPKILDLMAYVGNGVPPSLATDNPNYWDGWTVIHTYDNSDPEEYPFDVNNATISQIGFAKGLDASFEYDNVPKAQYYRLRCRAAWTPWNPNSRNFSLSEITFWIYNYIE